MNQILLVEIPVKKRITGKKASIKSIILFFCIIILLFGIALISMGLISYNGQENSTSNEITNVKNEPKIETIVNISKLKIKALSESRIAKIEYNWNNGEKNIVNDLSEIEINIPLGTNILTVTVTDENGLSKTYQEEFIGVPEYKPTIALIQKDGQDIMTIKYDSDEIVKHILYYFDGGEAKINEVNNTSGEIPIELIGGKHDLTIEVTNEKRQTYIEHHPINVPVINIVTDGTKFIIKVEDNSKNGIISVVSILNNNRIEKTIDNQHQYEDEIELEDGDNRLIFIVKNSENVLISKRIRFEK